MTTSYRLSSDQKNAVCEAASEAAAGTGVLWPAARFFSNKTMLNQPGVVFTSPQPPQPGAHFLPQLAKEKALT